MARAPFQVLVIAYFIPDDVAERAEFAVFQRLPRSGSFWQWISGGGEGAETPDEAARREGYEEGGLDIALPYLRLDSMSTIPRHIFADHETWTKNPYVVPEYSYGVRLPEKSIRLSPEHQAFEWVTYDTAVQRLKWDSNRNALWELRERIRFDLRRTELP